MPPKKILHGLLIAAGALLAGCSAVVLHPQGDVALQQRNLIYMSTGLMLLIILPVIALTLLFAWRYRASNKKATYTPEWNHSTMLELLIWSAPLLIVMALGALTWVSTHELDPYRPLGRISASRPVVPENRPLTVEVVALNWKWLFIYPEQGIATVNELAAPVDRPIRFKITASSVMNSFFIPSLAGQIYAMPGMETTLQAVINKTGVYEGFSANFSGDGFSSMHFQFHGMTTEDFNHWVQQARDSGRELNRDVYRHLALPSERDPVQLYSRVAPDLYDAVVNQCVEPDHPCMKDAMNMGTHSGMGTPANPPAGASSSRASQGSALTGMPAAGHAH
ncbi:MAG TPA: ubiquinol oxidase subunit II [Rhodanobacter sp.]